MPALPPVPFVLQILLGTKQGPNGTSLNRMHLKYTGSGPANADCTALAASIYSAYMSQFASNMPSLWTLESVTVTDLASTSGGTGVHVASTPGTSPNGENPAHTAALFNHHIQRRYRGGKPRSYMAIGTITDLLNAQQWKSASITSMSNAFNAFVGNLKALTWTGGNVTDFVSVSYYEGFTSVVDPITGRTRDVPKVRTGTIPVDSIASSSMNPNLGTQRRRIIGP